jgi:hypothetical protein
MRNEMRMEEAILSAIALNMEGALPKASLLDAVRVFTDGILPTANRTAAASER